MACVKYLKTKGFLDARNDDDETLLHLAAKTNDSALANALLDAGANVDSTTENGETPLLMAVGDENVELVKLLLKRGAAVNHSTLQSETALHMATAGNIMPIVKALLKYGADVHAPDSFQETPLHHAVFYGHLEMIRAFLKHGANINQDSEGGSPLYQAISNGRIDALNLLIDLGADFDLMNPDGFDVDSALKELKVTIQEVDDEGSDWESDDSDDEYLRDPLLFDTMQNRVAEVLDYRVKARAGNVDFFIQLFNQGKIPPKAQVMPLLPETKKAELMEWARVARSDMRGLYAFNYHGEGEQLANPPGPISVKLCELLLLPEATRHFLI